MGNLAKFPIFYLQIQRKYVLYRIENQRITLALTPLIPTWNVSQ
jgi:hypothetical protein